MCLRKKNSATPYKKKQRRPQNLLIFVSSCGLTRSARSASSLTATSTAVSSDDTVDWLTLAAAVGPLRRPARVLGVESRLPAPPRDAGPLKRLLGTADSGTRRRRLWRGGRPLPPADHLLVLKCFPTL